ncbi:hypothetical protein PMAYCL1PPCAC_32046, partial [Pristionchus mayeri]
MSSVDFVLFFIHTLSSILSITFSALLVVIVFRNTPASFSSFGIMLKIHAVFDLYVAISGAVGMQRVIPIDWSLLFVSHGPCQYFGATACYISLTMLIGGACFTRDTLVASFVFRYLVIRGMTPSTKGAFALICLVALPLSIIYA